MREPIFSITKKDFELTWFSGTGAGGQHRNKHQNCCRIKHVETGVLKTGQSNRTREANQKEAFLAIVNDAKFKSWLKIKTSEFLTNEASIQEKVDSTINDIIVEVKDENGKWIKEES